MVESGTKKFYYALFRPASGFPGHPEPAPASPEGDEVEHLRQHVGHDGEVRKQPGGPR